MHFRDQVTFLHNISDQFLQFPGRRNHDTGGGAGHFRVAQLLFDVAALSFESVNSGFGGLYFLGSAAGQQHPQPVLRFGQVGLALHDRLLAGFVVFPRNELFLEQLRIALQIFLGERVPFFSTRNADPGQLDVLRSRPGLQQPELRLHLGDVGFGPQQCGAVVPI